MKEKVCFYCKWWVKGSYHNGSLIGDCMFNPKRRSKYSSSFCHNFKHKKRFGRKPKHKPLFERWPE